MDLLALFILIGWLTILTVWLYLLTVDTEERTDDLATKYEKRFLNLIGQIRSLEDEVDDLKATTDRLVDAVELLAGEQSVQ